MSNAKTITTIIAFKDGSSGTKQVGGAVTHIYVGNKRYKFLIHTLETKELFLTHYETGQGMGSLTPIFARHDNETVQNTATREFAKELIADAIEQHGVEMLHRVLNDAPVINE